MNWTQIFRDDGGAISSMRVIFVLWGFGVFTVWTILSIIARQMQPIPSGTVEIMGMCLGGKVIQSFSENATTITSNQPISQVNRIITVPPS